MVRLAQDFNTRYLLVDGHGNFGSVDGDSAWLCYANKNGKNNWRAVSRYR